MSLSRFALSLLALALLLTSQPAVAHTEVTELPKAYPSAKQYRPTPLPDRIVISWSEDPSNSLDITYRTDSQTQRTLCQWIKASEILGDHRSGAVPEAKQIPGTNEPFKSNAGEARIHSVPLRDLTPATCYAYRVGDGINWSAWHHFNTASDKPEPFEFLYFGDAQNAVRALWSRVRREAHAESPRAAFAIHAGDLINHANYDAEWGEWHEAAGWLNATIPTVAVPGNHEYGLKNLKQTVSGHWKPQFSLPKNGLEGLEETSYWFEYQGVRFIALDSNTRQKEQGEWLDQLLTKLPPARWTIATFHHPIFSAAKNRDNDTLRKLWKPLFDKHGVDLALQGHDHAYARSGLGGPRDGVVGTENVGEGLRSRVGQTVYVVSVSGPKNYTLNDSWDVSRAGSGLQLYQVLRAAPDQIEYQSFRANGDLYDAFTLKKDAEGKVELVEQAEGPEIRR